MSIHVLQADFSIEHQRRLVVEELPELEAFIIIGRRPPKKQRGNAKFRILFFPSGRSCLCHR